MEVLPLPPPPFPSSTPPSPTRIVGAFRSAPSSPPRISDLLLDDLDSDFAFHVAADLNDSLFFAEELFDGGRIKAAQQPPPPPPSQSPPHAPEERGRGRGKGLDGGAMSRSCRRGARSLSPVRSGKDLWRVEVESFEKGRAAVVEDDPPPEPVVVSAARGSRKWSLKDLLFRSASEGHASDKHAPRFGGAWVASRRGEAPARKNAASSSAHERHYIWKKAAAEDMKKKTFLPYKQGILGRFSFTGLGHAPARSKR